MDSLWVEQVRARVRVRHERSWGKALMVEDPRKRGPASGDEDALLEAVLEEALSVYKGVVSEELLAIIREQLGDTLAATRDGRALIRAMSPDPEVQRSEEVQGQVPTSAEDPATKVANKIKKAGGGEPGG